MFFGLPSSPTVDATATNAFVAEQIGQMRESRGLMLVRPGDIHFRRGGSSPADLRGSRCITCSPPRVPTRSTPPFTSTCRAGCGRSRTAVGL